MSTKRKSPFADEEEEENGNCIQSIDIVLSSHILHIKHPDPSLRLKSLTVISAHLNSASPHFLTQTIKPSLEHQLWQETNPQLAQHIIKILADIATHKNIDKNNNYNNILSTVNIFHKFLEANQFSDDFITTQIVSSLIYIAQQKGLFRALDRVLALNLLCSNKAGLRAKVLNLLALTTKSKEGGNGGDGSIFFHVFEGFTKDPYVCVRKAALDGLVALHEKGYQLTTGCYMRACALLQDKFELVRLSAIKVICNYVDVLHQTNEGHTTNKINQAFFQLCTLSRDMDMRVRSEALEALGGMGPLSERVLLQALCKRVLGQATKKTSNETLHGDEHMVDCGEELDLLTISAAGALLHGVEDEFCEVRIATIHSLEKLSRFSKQFAGSALDLLMDLLNDDSLEVRMQTLDGLLHMGQTGHLTVQERHMHMFLGLLEDINHDIRSATRRLFVHTKLSSMVLFNMSIDALMTNLDKHPQDEQDIIYVMYHMGKIHSTFVVCSVNEFVQQIITHANGELGLDHPHVPALIILLLGAQISNVGICYQIPKTVVSYVNYFQVKYHITLFESSEITKGTNPPLEVFERSQNSDCKGLSSSSEVPNQEEDNEMVEKRCQGIGSETIELTPNFMATDMEDIFAYDFANCEASGNVTDMPEKRQNENYLLHKSNILHSVTNIVRVVAGTWLFLKQKPVIYILKTLRKCRETLQKLERKFEDSTISQISFASLYTRSVHFLVKIWANLTPTCKHASQSVKDSSRHLLENLDKAVRRMKNCYLGLCEEQELRILELNVLVYLLKLSLLGVNEPYVFRILQSLISSGELLYEGDGLRHSLFLLRIKKQLSDEDTKSISFLKLGQELPEQFSLQPIPLGKLKEIKADLVIPNNSYEHPFRFIPGMPLGIPVHITLHNVTSECRIWTLMVLGDFVQYNLLDFSEFQGPGRKKHGAITLPFYSTVKVASCFLEVSVTLECPFEFDRVSSSMTWAGPKGHLVSLTTVEKVNLVASV